MFRVEMIVLWKSKLFPSTQYYSDESIFQGCRYRLRFGVDVEFLVDSFDVGVNRVRTDIQAIRNHLIAMTVNHQLEDIHFSRCELIIL